MTELVLTINGQRAVLDAEEVRKALDKLKASGKGATDQLGGLDKALSVASRAAGIFGVALSAGALVSYTRNVINAADKLNDLSKRTGVAVETLSKLDLVARTNGTSIEALAGGINKLNRNLSEATTGNKDVEKSFTRLGLSIKDLQNLSPEKRFLKIVDAINSLRTVADKTRAGTDLMGRSFAELIPALEGGSAAIQKVFNQLERTGAVLSGDEAKKIDEFNDRWDTLTFTLERLSQRGFVKLFDNFDAIVQRIGLVLPGIALLNAAFSKLNETFDHDPEAEFWKGKPTNSATAYAAKAQALGFATSVGGLNSLPADDKTEGKTIALRDYNRELDKSIKLAQADIVASTVSTAERGRQKAIIEGAAKAQEDYNNGVRASPELTKKEIEQLGNKGDVLAKLNVQLEEQKRLMSLAAQAVEDTRTPAEKLNKQLDDLSKARKYANSVPGASEKETLDALNKAMQKARDEVDPTAQAFKDMATDIRNAFSDSFERLFNGELKSWGDFADSIWAIFKKLLAQMATLAITTPIIVPIITALGGSLGLSAGAISSVTGQLGGAAGGAGNALSLASLGSSALDLLKGGSSTALAGVFDQVGSVFGLGTNLLPSGAVGTNIVGGLSNYSTLTNGSFGGTLGGAAGGFAGNFLANKIFGNRGIGADIGGTLGAIAGSFIPVPIVGTAIGSFLGNAIGGLFGGGKPSNKQQFVDLNLGSGAIYNTGGQTGKKFSQENLDAAKSFATIAYTLSNAINGVGALTDKLRVFVGSRDGSGIQFDPENSGKVLNYGSDPGAFIKGLTTELMNHGGEKVGTALNTALEHIDFSRTKDHIDEVIGDIVFAAGFDKIGDQFDTVVKGQVETAFDAMQTRFEELRKQAERLGLPLDKLNANLEKVRMNFVNQYNSGNASTLIGQMSPVSSALYAEQQRFNDQVKEAKAIGGELAIVYQIHANAVAQIEQQYDGVTAQLQAQATAAGQLADQFTAIMNSLDKAIFDLKVSNLSTLSPQQQLAEAQARFRDAATKAKLGDPDAASQLSSLGNTYASIAKSFFGSNQDYAVVFNEITGELSAARDTAQRQVNLQQQIVSNTQAQLSVTANGFSRLEQIQKMSSFSVGNSATDFSAGIFGANNPNETVIKNLGAINSSGLFPVVDQLLYTYTSGITPGSKRRSQFFELFPDQAAAFRTAAHQLGIPGFARGGTTPMNSPFVVGESGIEVMAQRQSAMVIPIQNNAEILNAVRESNRHLPAIVNVLQAGLADSIIETRKNAAAIRRLADAVRQKKVV